MNSHLEFWQPTFHTFVFVMSGKFFHCIIFKHSILHSYLEFYNLHFTHLYLWFLFCLAILNCTTYISHICICDFWQVFSLYYFHTFYFTKLSWIVKPTFYISVNMQHLISGRVVTLNWYFYTLQNTYKKVPILPSLYICKYVFVCF